MDSGIKNEGNIKIGIALVVSLFFLWGLSYGLIDAMNKNFQNHLHITQHESGFLQLAYFGAYFIIALPAGFIAQRFSYRVGIIFGLALYVIGCLLIIPAANAASFPAFLFAFFVLACGLGSLETNANPYIVNLGAKEQASFRINAAQSFNGVGQLIGPLIAGTLLLSITRQEEGASQEQINAALESNMGNVLLVYAGIAFIVALVALVFILIKLPEPVSNEYKNQTSKASLGEKLSSLFGYRFFVFGLIAQFLYVAAQVGSGAFFINYSIEHYEGMTDEKASYYLSVALGAFMVGRIISTPLMRKINSSLLLLIYSSINVLVCLYLFSAQGYSSILALIALFFFMSISFPTIFALSTASLPSHLVKLASSLLIMSIVGGALMPMLMGAVNDNYGTGAGYALLIPCFAFVAFYAFYRFSTSRDQA